ncbi:hypothetical protein Ancab_019858 [Ancistrocladus abbreviatus]
MGYSPHLFYFTIFLVALAWGSIEAELVPFDKNYYILYGHDHAAPLDGGAVMELTMDKTTGAGFRSKNTYLTGVFEMKIKLPRNSTGVVTTYYLTSLGSQHAEIDMEFLGENLLHTNIYIDSIGNREKRVNLTWFDPTADFHTYKIILNPKLIALFVDEIPIRLFKRKPDLPYVTKPMHVMGTMWSASDWAGTVDWSKQPFKAQYQGFNISGCPASEGPQKCESPTLSWNTYEGFDPKQQQDFDNIKKFISYDYCTDKNRVPPTPNEC